MMLTARGFHSLTMASRPRISCILASAYAPTFSSDGRSGAADAAMTLMLNSLISVTSPMNELEAYYSTQMLPKNVCYLSQKWIASRVAWTPALVACFDF